MYAAIDHLATYTDWPLDELINYWRTIITMKTPKPRHFLLQLHFRRLRDVTLNIIAAEFPTKISQLRSVQAYNPFLFNKLVLHSLQAP